MKTAYGRFYRATQLCYRGLGSRNSVRLSVHPSHACNTKQCTADILISHESAITLHCVSKKVPTFKLSLTLSNLNRFSKFLHCWKACEICYKTTEHYPPHLRHVATLPWDIKKIKFSANIQQIWKKYKQIAFSVHRFQSLCARNYVC